MRELIRYLMRCIGVMVLMGITNVTAAQTVPNTPAVEKKLTLDDLTDTELKVRNYSLDQSAELRVAASSVKDALSRKFVTYEWSKWKNIRKPDGTNQRVGVSIQLVLDVNVINADAKLEGVPYMFTVKIINLMVMVRRCLRFCEPGPRTVDALGWRR
jgi:ABC-type antimicrobial peptide transport system ATPase subunit